MYGAPGHIRLCISESFPHPSRERPAIFTTHLADIFLLNKGSGASYKRSDVEVLSAWDIYEVLSQNES